MSRQRHHRSATRRRGTRRHRQRRDEDRTAFLTTMAEILGRSLDLDTTLASIASLALPHRGGWCIVDLLEKGRVRRVAVVHADHAKQVLVRKLESGWPPKREEPFGVPLAMRTRRAEVIGPVTPVMLREMVADPDAVETLTRLGIGSMLVVPLLGSSGVLGAVTYVSPLGSHRFHRGDVAFAEAVAHRAAQAIENAQLYSAARHAEREASDANRSKLAFLATLSHELRTPLHAIAGYAQLLIEEVPGPLTATQADQVRRIQRNERHLLDLVDAVLGFARLDAGHTTYDYEDVPLSLVMTDLEAIVEPIAGSKGVVFAAVLPPPPPIVVRTDPRKLCQILVNLVNNAVKFSRRGASVQVAAVVHDTLALVRVSDAGIGMTAKQLAALFQPYVQPHRRGTAGEEGTGLGLAISRRLARDMGGDLVVESRAGTGSIFTLSIPLVAAAQTTPAGS